MSDYPNGDPMDFWSHAELDAYAEAHNIEIPNGTKAEKVGALSAAILEREDLPVAETEEVELLPGEVAEEPPSSRVLHERDPWRNAKVIPSGAQGPTVSRIRAALGLEEEGSLDRHVALRLRAHQRRVGLPATGRVEGETRASLGL